MYVLSRGQGALTTRTETQSSRGSKPRPLSARNKASRRILSFGGGVVAFIVDAHSEKGL